MAEQLDKQQYDDHGFDGFQRLKMVDYIKRTRSVKLEYDEWDGLTDEEAAQKAMTDYGLNLYQIHEEMWKGL